MAIQSNSFPIGKWHVTTIAKTVKTVIAGGFAIALIAGALFLNTDGLKNNTAATQPTASTDRTAS